MSINLVQQQQQQQQQDELHGMMPSLMSQQNNYVHHHSTPNDEYAVVNHHNHLGQPNALSLSYSSSVVRQQQSQQATHHYNDQDQYPSYEEFDAIVQDYLQNLSSKKRDKALIDQARYAMILQVLKDPRNTAVSTAQFRFWVKKMFQLTPRQIVCHDGKPVAMREQIYGILVRAHREAHHGGRDKTSALVRRRYSWIPKELIARFVRHCPFCISRRNGSQQSPLSLGIFLPATPPTYSMMPTSSSTNEEEKNRLRAPSMMASSSSASSSASYPDEMMMMAAAAAHHQQQEHTSMSPYGAGSTIDISWPPHQQQNYYAAAAAMSVPTGTTDFFNSQQTSSDKCNSTEYYSNTRHPYSMTYSSSNNLVADIEEQPMMMQPAVSVYYAQEYGLKQNTNYPLLENSNQSNNMTFVTPSSRNNSLFYSNNNPSQVAPTVTPSPSLSPSSSSTSATSSPVHPVYHESANRDTSYIHPQRQQASNNNPSGTLNLLSHQQSLF